MKGLSQYYKQPVMVQTTSQYTQRVQNLRLHFVD